MIHLNIKPLSVNEAYKLGRSRGRCIMMKSKEYKVFKSHMHLILPKIAIPTGPKKLTIHWGFRSRGSDIDNPTKAFIDCIQEKYGFNDNTIYELVLKKEISKTPYIKFKIEAIL